MEDGAQSAAPTVAMTPISPPGCNDPDLHAVGNHDVDYCMPGWPLSFDRKGGQDFATFSYPSRPSPRGIEQSSNYNRSLDTSGVNVQSFHYPPIWSAPPTQSPSCPTDEGLPFDLLAQPPPGTSTVPQATHRSSAKPDNLLVAETSIIRVGGTSHRWHSGSILPDVSFRGSPTERSSTSCSAGTTGNTVLPQAADAGALPPIARGLLDCNDDTDAQCATT